MNSSPTAYDKVLDDYYPIIEKLLLQAYSKLSWTENDTWMDIGVGTGRMTNCLLQHVGGNVKEIVGIDFSPVMVDFAKVHSHADNLTYHVADIADRRTLLPEWKDHFDNIISLNCLHWVTDIRSAFRNIFYLLAPGGECALSFIGKTSHLEYFNTLGKDPKWTAYLEGKQQYVPRWSYMESQERMAFFETHLRDAGFTVFSCNEGPQDLHLNDSQFRKRIESFCTLLVHIPEEKRQAFINSILETAMKGESQIVYPQRRMVIYGKK